MFVVQSETKILNKGNSNSHFSRIVMFSHSNSKGFFSFNWFTLLVIVVLAFIFLKKDISLNFNLNAPLKMKQEIFPHQNETPQKTKVKRKKKDSKLTQKAPIKVAEKKKSGTSMLNFFGSSKSSKQIDLKVELDKIEEATKQGYLKRFAHVAVNEQKKYGIPASIILANGLLHSLGGQRDLAVDYQNHFSIPCGIDWDGGTGSANGVCYRTYETAWMSFRNHSLYITSGKFSETSKLNPTDYKSFAKTLERLQFSNTKNLSTNLIKIIEQYGLDDLDK